MTVFTPKQYQGVMVSSTFEDLKEHRAALMRAIEGQQLHSVAMESDAALPDGTVLDSSLLKVRDAAAYVGVISHKYGQVPECDENPDRLSLTELEFREARRLGRPILIFIMGPTHPVTVDSVELDPEKRRKLEAFREDAKRISADSSIHRVYRVFNDLADFATAATQSVGELRRHLAVPEIEKKEQEGIPRAPELYAQPRYIGSHTFVGRQAQLATLSDWASAADQHTVLLFEAIGGTGKSMLTWEWTTHHASGSRGDWAGMFWYSFYEKGAVMADFCRRALAYMTGSPLSAFAGKNQSELSELLLLHLESKPWLLVLDGLERVLVAYHRYDAARLPDEEAGTSDQIAQRDPCAAIRPEDDDLLWRLTGTAPSKILITSRLVPRVLLNPASQPIPGVLHERLPGLRPADAETLLRSCEVTGDSTAMQAFLQRHCDCHPLVIGIVAGLINDYLPARGDFDAWEADTDHGGHLNIGELNLTQKRNHILHTALAALSKPSRQLLSTVALLSEAVDYEILIAFNPHSSQPIDAARKLARTVSDLERRGLIQYDTQTKHYDLHPVVRAVAANDLRSNDLTTLGQRVIDHFATRPHISYEKARSLEDLRDRLTVIRTLLQMGRMQTAYRAYRTGVSDALTYKLESPIEDLSLLRPFFTSSWISPSKELHGDDADQLMAHIAALLMKIGETDEALKLFEHAMGSKRKRSLTSSDVVTLTNISMTLNQQNRISRSGNCSQIALDLAWIIDDPAATFMAQLQMFNHLAQTSQVAEAESMWQSLDIDRPWDDTKGHCGQAELYYAWFRFNQGLLVQEDLTQIEVQGREHGNRYVIRGVHKLRAELLSQHGDWHSAVPDLIEAIRMAREVGIAEPWAEVQLTLAHTHLGLLPDPRQEAERLATISPHQPLTSARLWHAIGHATQASRYALAAYRLAWADGEPYVRRYDLKRAEMLLNELGIEIPVLPSYDPSKDPRRPWEYKVEALIAKLRAEKTSRDRHDPGL